MDDLIFYENGKAIGIVAPSTFYSSAQGEVIINGPDAICQVMAQDETCLRRALMSAGALVIGDESEVAAVEQLLQDPATSRTTSYFLCVAKTCAEVITDIAAIRSSRILIGGCGGIGSSLCMLLAGAGVRDFVLVDPDIVEESNLNRQLFWTLADVGRAKVDVLSDALNARFRGIKITSHRDEAGIEQYSDLIDLNTSAVAITADNPPTLAHDSVMLSEKFGIPVVSGGYIHRMCTSYFFSPYDAHEVVAQFESKKRDSSERLPSSIMPSYGPINFSLASKLSANILSAIAKNTFGSSGSWIETWDMSIGGGQPY
jgi:molybdopterin/thiamine biosynthesis adenylyltransferase